MSGGIYTGQEARALADAIRRGDPSCDPGIADLAASVAHWETRAKDETSRAARWQEEQARASARAAIERARGGASE